jgi:hypothetical protein
MKLICQKLRDAIELDLRPGADVVRGFGLESDRHYEFLAELIRRGRLSDEDLERASSSPAILNEIAAREGIAGAPLFSS